MSSHFIQAHALLNLQLLHSRTADNPVNSSCSPSEEARFPIYSPLSHGPPHARPPPGNFGVDPEHRPFFTARDLISVMHRITTQSHPLPYFGLCRELGTDVVDSMIRGRILELRWSCPVTEEGTHPLNASEDKTLGPRLLATTPIMKYAMKEVLSEYQG